MSNEIIKVLEYISNKLGIAIDWTAANVYPQVMDVLGRYRVMKIVEASLGLLLGALFSALAIWCAAKLLKDRSICKSEKRKTRYHRYWEYSGEVGVYDLGGFLLAGAIVGALIAVAFIVINSISIFQWAFVPEMQYYELLTSLIGG